MKPKSGRLIARGSMHAEIVPRLRADIVENRWAPGERLPEPMLCEEFGVSRTPLRDALKVLETEGLIELIPHVGAVVTQPSSPELEAKLQVLAALEALAAELAARRRSPVDLERIQRLQERMNDAAKKKDVEGYYKLNDEFHRQVVLASGNATLADMHEHLMWHVHRVRHAANEHEQLSAVSANEHDVIVRSIVTGKHAEAARAMRGHIDAVAQKIVGSPWFERLGKGEASKGRAVR
jgi:DNA-binding GntR family transcriptional regulator